MGPVVAIVQARMGASRLPNKMLLHLHGYPIIEWVYRRILLARRVDRILFALPDIMQDDLLAWYLKSIGAEVCRGSEMDLVDRYYHIAKNENAGRVVRICADNPLICASEIDRLIDYFQQNRCDYAYNHIPRKNNWPDGLGAEICHMSLLEEIHANASKPESREHLFNHVLENAEKFKIASFDPPKELAHPELKLDVDTMSDYRRLLQAPYRIEMNAREVVQTALANTPLSKH